MIIQKYRIECSCGYQGTEAIEWLEPYERETTRYQKWIYAFCKRMTGKDVSILFGISKHLVYRLDKKGFSRELSQQKSIEPRRISIDKISRKKGHRYATIISAPEERKIPEVVKGRKAEAAGPFFKEKGSKWSERIEMASMDAWQAFRTVVTRYCKNVVICHSISPLCECVWSVITDYIHRGAGGSGRRFSARPVRRRYSNILFSSRNGDMYQNMHRMDVKRKMAFQKEREKVTYMR